MPAPEVRCPNCRTALRPAPGPARVNRCPACGGNVPIPASAPTPVPVVARAAPPAPRPRYDDDPPRRPVRRPRDDDDDDDDRDRRPARKTKARKPDNTPLIVGAVVGVCALFAVGVGVVVAMSAGGRSAPEAVAAAPAPTPAPPPVRPVRATPVVAEPAPVAVAPAAPIPAGDVIPRIKESTVYIRSHFKNGLVGMGSGFFAGQPGKVVTNAHVVGYDKDDGYRHPEKVEVIVASGETNQRTFTAGLFGFDVERDLAVLAVADPDLPAPLGFGSAEALQETQEVLIFGYPHGEKLGLNVSVNKSTVSSLRRENGKLERVQVAGGMHPGNSGGPVVNTAGQVIGVSVSGIVGEQINFAIPAETAAAFVREQVASGGTKNLGGAKPAVDMVRVPGRLPGRPGGAPGRSLIPGPSGGTPGIIIIMPGAGPAGPGGTAVAAPGRPPTVAARPGPTAPTSLPASDPDGNPRIQGGGADPIFRETSPTGGLLAGLDVGLGKLGANVYIRGVRPIYRSGVTDTPGATRGNLGSGRPPRALAKPGYAIGAVTVRSGLTVDGLSVTFMKVGAGGKLDPTDSYESDWVGSPGGEPVKLGGDGTPVVGIAGRTGGGGLTGFGIVAKPDKP